MEGGVWRVVKLESAMVKLYAKGGMNRQGTMKRNVNRALKDFSAFWHLGGSSLSESCPSPS